MKKRLIILGSTGSIGTRTLDVVRDFADRFEVVALTSNSRSQLLAQQALEFRPQALCLCSAGKGTSVQDAAETVGARCFDGEAGLTQIVEQFEADLVVVATVGFVGLAPTLSAIRRGITIALANKEVLVTAGNMVMRAAHERKVRILPIDSEHNAIFQCMNGCGTQAVRRVILTASGGPFRTRESADMAGITREEALRHPTWNMGPKITIDSATLMNKGFEVIEGSHLFGLPVSQIEVVVHPQSTIHSMVEYVDGSIIAQLGLTDMYFPIQNVLLYPERLPNRFSPLDFAALQKLTFEKPDMDRFPCLRLAYEAADQGGTYPTVLNAANEIAVARFLGGEIAFMQIARIIDACLQAHELQPAEQLDAVLAADKWARTFAAQVN